MHIGNGFETSMWVRRKTGQIFLRFIGMKIIGSPLVPLCESLLCFAVIEVLALKKCSFILVFIFTSQK